MTILYQGKIVEETRIVSERQSALGALPSRPPTISFLLTPNRTSPREDREDAVTIKTRYGERILKGPDISTNRKCIENGIAWYDKPASKEVDC